MSHAPHERIFYHIYPLGMCGCPHYNDFSSPAGNGLLSLARQIPHLKDMGITTVYIGPFFESTAHGYDTLDYFHVDRRLGNNDSLKTLVRSYHENGIEVVLDAVLNHVGRHFHAFRDLTEHTIQSRYKDWFVGVDFSRKSPAGDDFNFEGWSGHYDLIKLNVANDEVKKYLFDAVRFWIDEFDIDGLRLDAADVLSPSFMDELSSIVKSRKPDFYLMGEVVHGDYRNWVSETRLDSVTNYELYKGLWSSFNDANFYELSWTLNRQYGKEGMYKNLQLYSFVDNHDVNRLASSLTKNEHLFPVYGLMFTLPGTPSIYYGSEWGLRGERTKTSDRDLRPFLDASLSERDETRVLASMSEHLRSQVSPAKLNDAIKTFARVRREHPSLSGGNWKELYLSHEQYAFARETTTSSQRHEKIIVAINSSGKPARFSVKEGKGRWTDALDPGYVIETAKNFLEVEVPSSWLRILVSRE